MKPEREHEYLKLLEALIAVDEAVKGTPAKGDERVLDAKNLLLKVFCHACSAFHLSRSTTVKDLDVSFFDCASVQVVCRAALESFLVFQYVFMSPKNKEEKDFRYWSWQRAGLMERQKLLLGIEEDFAKAKLERQTSLLQNKKKLDREKEDIKNLRDKIESNPCFKALDRDQQKQQQKKKIRKGGWRLQGWKSIAEDAGLSKTNAEIYSYLCGYAHSSYLSVMQIRQAKKAQDQQELTAPILEVLMSVMAFMVKACLDFFHQPQNVLNDEQTRVVDSWYKIGSGNGAAEVASDKDESAAPGSPGEPTRPENQPDNEGQS